VILPIYRDDETRTQVLEYCHRLKTELSNIAYAGRAVEVQIDDRDLRGGEKKWYHVKRGVPLRIEVGPKDIAKDAVFLARRDNGQSSSVSRAELLAKFTSILDEMQANLFERAKQLRTENTVILKTEKEFREYFTPTNAEQPEIHGGFAQCHFAGEQEVQPLLDELKVTIRCMPLEGNVPGTCFLTGKPAEKHAVFAKAY
jgi:prolyl-tRNA synthetase